MSAAIRVENLSKEYRLGVRQASGYRTLRESLTDAVGASWKRLLAPLTRGREDASNRGENTLWALKDVSFSIRPGEVVGIIGRNGAGKSTLLKILSRITEPTTGRAVVRGRMGSLLEVGTGFHPELTGRENIFMNGSILGMSRRDTRRKFDEIVQFAEVESFIDTPVKRYSSGMYVRLAFAVAAYLEPEILIVDEVLAVGDIGFQKKCLGRIKELGQLGGTVLFVSHNMGTIACLCDRVFVMSSGRILSEGNAATQVRDYVASLSERSTIDLRERDDRVGNGLIRIVNVQTLDETGIPVESVLAGNEISISLQYEATSPVSSIEAFVWLCNAEGQRVTALSNRYTGELLSDCPRRGSLQCTIPKLALSPGTYLLDFTILNGLDVADHVVGAGQFEIVPGPFFASGRLPPSECAIVFTSHSWRLSHTFD